MKKRVAVSIATIFFCLSASTDELGQMRKMIEEVGARWTAGRTSVSDLSSEQMGQLCGLILPDDFSRRGVSPPLPVLDSVWDWRDRDGNDWMTPIRNQGPCGSCWAFGALGALESGVKIYWNDPGLPVDLSEQYLVSCSNGSCNGFTLFGTTNFLQSDGTPDEDCFPYEAADLPCEQRCSDWRARLTRIGSWEWVPSDSVKRVLMDGPIYTGMEVYPSFQYYTGGIYEKLPDENSIGGHAVVICGWNDADSCWICKNSWGTRWGEDGWFRIKWGDSDIGFDNIAMVLFSGLAYVSYEFNDSICGDDDGVLNPGEEVVLTVTIKNMGDTVTAVTGELNSLDLSVSIADSIGFYGDVLPLSCATNLLDPFQLATTETGQIPFTLDLAGSEKRRFTEQLDFSIDVTLNQTGWPLDLSGSVSSSPAIIDLDGDGVEELIVGGNDGNLYVKEVDGSDKVGFPFSTGDGIVGSPAVGDLNGDGELEIVVAVREGSIYILSDSGDVMTHITTPHLILGTPVLSDLNDDGFLEITVGCMDGSIRVLTHDGSDYPNFPFSIGGMITTGAAVADLNGDGLKDIVVGSVNDTVYAVSSSGSLLWKFPTQQWVRSAPSIADIEGLKVIVGSWDENLYILNADGTEYARMSTDGAIKTSPSFEDLDGDGDLEIVFSSGKKLFVCHHDGTTLNNWPREVESSIQSSACFADMDDDGVPEIIFGSDDGRLYAYEPDGSLMPYFPIPTEAKIVSSPAVSDLDGDRDTEIVFGNNSGIQIIDCKSDAGGDRYWRMYRGNPQRTGCYGDFVDVREEYFRDEYKVRLHQNCPNPFSTETAVRFSLARSAQVTVKIYDLAGRLVKALVDGEKSAGYHRAYWDGTDQHREKVSAGIYFCKLSLRTGLGTSEFTCTKKMIFLR